MKRKLLSCAVALFASASLFAQQDVTPSRYVFANQPVGAYSIDLASTGANPASGFAGAVENFNNGYIMINNGQFTSQEAPNVLAIKQGLSIVDLGGEVGKVLSIKGKDSTFPYGIASETAFIPGWWNMSFYTSSTNIEKEEKVRFSIVFKIIENTPDAVSGFMAFDVYTYQNDNLFNANTNPTGSRTTYMSGDFVLRYEDDNSPVEDDNGDYIYDDELWHKYECDFQAGETSGIPLRFVMAFANQATKFNSTTLLIKSLTMTKNPEGEASITPVRFTMDPTSTGIQKVDPSVPSILEYACNNNVVTFYNLVIGEKVQVYSLTGQLIESFVATGNNSVTLNNGLYIVKAGNRTLKVSVK